MSTKLYVKYGSETKYISSFRDREAAMKHFELIRAQLRCELGVIVTPIYVDTGKGRGK